MSAEDNKSLNRRWVQAFNEQDWATEAACRATGYQAHMSGMPGPLDAGSWAGFMNVFTTAFPDAKITIDEDVSEQNLVSSRWTLTGTHRGEFQGVPPTGRQITIQGVDFSRVAEGKIAEHWAQFDLVGLMQQLGALS